MFLMPKYSADQLDSIKKQTSCITIVKRKCGCLFKRSKVLICLCFADQPKTSRASVRGITEKYISLGTRVVRKVSI